MCMSCPQACITGTIEPLWGRLIVEAKGEPVVSSTGRPSKSARMSAVGPSPLRKMATIPKPPMPSTTSQAYRPSWRRIRRAVSTSSPESSG